jgi:nucleoside diphosphate kinase
MHSSKISIPTKTKRLIESGDIALVIYSPDALLSNLIPSIEHEIQNAANCSPTFRLWVKHNEFSIEQFYINSINNNQQNWHLISKLFTFGPSLVTLWNGAEAQKKISSMKGSSHPAYAKSGTIRSKFWCDNSICNLIHVSDNSEEIFRELSIISSINLDCNFQKVVSSSLFYSPYFPIPCHNSLFTICGILSRHIIKNSEYSAKLEIPADDRAFSSAKYAMSWLEGNFLLLETELSKLVINAIEKKISFCELSTYIVSRIPTTDWEKILVQCSVNAFDVWNDKLKCKIT